MALIYTEGFDWLATADMPNGYDTFNIFNVQTPGNRSHSIVAGRTGNAYRNTTITGGVNPTRISYVNGINFGNRLIAPANTWIVGFAWRYSRHNGPNLYHIASCLSGASNDTTYANVTLFREAAGGLRLDTINGTNITRSYGQGTTILNPDTWYYIEIKGFIDGTSGTYEVRVNGTTDISFTGDNNVYGTSFGGFFIGGNNPDALTGHTFDVDDIYICDTSGSRNNDFLGPIQIQTLRPNGNGNSSQLTGSDGNSVDNYLLVDDASPDGDTTYVESGTSGQKDTYTFENTNELGTIYGVNLKNVGKKSAAGGKDMIGVQRSGATESDSPILGHDVDYRMGSYIRETNPNTSTDWTSGDIDAAEFGIKVE